MNATNKKSRQQIRRASVVKHSAAIQTHKTFELRASLLHSRTAPSLPIIHRIIRRGLQRDPFSLTSEISSISCQLCIQALSLCDEERWRRIEMLLGYPGASFADTQFQGNITPVLLGIATALESEEIQFEQIGGIEELVISFLIRNTHAAYARTQMQVMRSEEPDIKAQNQLRAALRAIEIVGKRTQQLKNPALEARLQSCIRRTSNSARRR